MDWSQPYPSQRSPVVARNLIASSQPLAVEAGISALKAGGNAVDAALATAITLTVVEPCNNGVGSDAFGILWDGQSLVGLNASGRAPAAWGPERFEGLASMPTRGWDSVTVPGAVSAWVTLSQRYGRLPFAALFTQAIDYAERGFHVGPKTAFYWHWATKTFEDFANFHEHFLIEGRAPRAGELFRRPELARSLRTIADTKGAAFYQGDLAEQIVATAQSEGGALAMDDLAAHEATFVKPLKQHYRNVALHEIPPNAQGLAAQIALGILAERDLASHGLDSAETVHLQIEAMKIAIRAAFDHFADASAMHVAPEALLDPSGFKTLAAGIADQASPLPPAALPVGADTVYLTTADEDGMMVSFIQSNYMGFGSGVVIPGTGIAMQNRGAGFSLDPDHPNCVGAGKRPFHTIIPGFVTENGDPRMSFGVMGGHMQHQGHVQMVSRIFDFEQNPQAASDAPRWHVYPDFSVGLEGGFSQDVASNLAARGHRVKFEELEHVFGGAQLIYRTSDGYVGASDHRKEGLVSGF